MTENKQKKTLEKMVKKYKIMKAVPLVDGFRVVVRVFWILCENGKCENNEHTSSHT